MSDSVVAAFGPTGYTGRKVLAELRRQGVTPLPVARDRRRLDALTDGDVVRVAGLDEGDALREGFHGVSAVINCVGPFALSAEAVSSAAIANGARYLDFTAEQAPVLALVEHMDTAARQAEVAIVPAAGFYGGLGDLLASLTASGLSTPVDVTLC